MALPDCCLTPCRAGYGVTWAWCSGALTVYPSSKWLFLGCQAWAEIWEPERHLRVSPTLPWGDTYWASEHSPITAFHGRTFELPGTSASVFSNPCVSSGSLPF
ncbi:unnamed protein product, partial [Gulo gulo]